MHGELLRLGYQLGESTVRRILRDQGYGPAPRKADASWRTFLRSQDNPAFQHHFFGLTEAEREAMVEPDTWLMISTGKRNPL